MNITDTKEIIESVIVKEAVHFKWKGFTMIRQSIPYIAAARASRAGVTEFISFITPYVREVVEEANQKGLTIPELTEIIFDADTSAVNLVYKVY